MGVLLRTENTEDIVILVDWLAKVASFLLIPPVGVGVAELAFHGRRVGVVSVLHRNDQLSVRQSLGGRRHTRCGSSSSA